MNPKRKTESIDHRNRAVKSPRDQLVKEIYGLAQYHGLNCVFTTFLELMALYLSLEADPMTYDERKLRYEEITANLEKQERIAYARMSAALFAEAQNSMDEPYDILGTVFMKLGLSNEWNGQFFSPDCVCRAMAMIVDEEQLPKKGCTMINEPACGSGAMVLGAVYAMKQNGQDYQHHSMFIAQDVDIRCVWMTYIQLCMYGIPAIVIHGDTVSMEEWSRWYTPYVTYVTFPECDSQRIEKEAV